MLCSQLSCFCIHHKLSLTKQEKAGLQHELSIVTSDHHRRQLEGQLTAVEKRISESVYYIQGCEELIQNYKTQIARKRGGAEERQRKEGE